MAHRKLVLFSVPGSDQYPLGARSHQHMTTVLTPLAKLEPRRLEQARNGDIRKVAAG